MAEGGADYVPSKASSEVKEGPNPYLLMEDIVDKLKILDYENSFCKKRTVAALQVPLTHTYFCIPQQNPNEQFFYFTSIFTFLLNQAGITFNNPGQFDDPNAVSASLVEELRKIGFVTDFPPSKLKQGYGDTICTVLNGLADFTLEKKNFKFKKPNYPEPGPDEAFDEAEEEESMVVDETIVDDGQIDETLNEDAFEDFGAPVNEESKIIESKIDPNEWKIEVERVSSQLQIPKVSDQKDWRTHLEKMASHQKVINEQLAEARGQLNKMVSEIGTTLDQVDTREKVINGQFDNLVNEFKLVKENLQDTMDKYNKASEKVNASTNELQNLVDDLEKVKHQMEQQGTSMTDTGPLVKLKNSMAKVREEIAQFDIRIGVIENILLQSKIRSKKNSTFGHL